MKNHQLEKGVFFLGGGFSSSFEVDDPIARSKKLTERCPVGFGPIQFLMEPQIF